MEVSQKNKNLLFKESILQMNSIYHIYLHSSFKVPKEYLWSSHKVHLGNSTNAIDKKRQLNLQKNIEYVSAMC